MPPWKPPCLLASAFANTKKRPGCPLVLSPRSLSRLSPCARAAAWVTTGLKTGVWPARRGQSRDEDCSPRPPEVLPARPLPLWASAAAAGGFQGSALSLGGHWVWSSLATTFLWDLVFPGVGSTDEGPFYGLTWTLWRIARRNAHTGESAPARLPLFPHSLIKLKVKARCLCWAEAQMCSAS